MTPSKMRSLCHLANAEKLERFTKTNKLFVPYRTLQLSGAPDPKGHLDRVIFLLQNQTKILMLLSGLAATVNVQLGKNLTYFWFLSYVEFGLAKI